MKTRKKARSSRRKLGRKSDEERELEKLAAALRIILECAEFRRGSNSDVAYERYKSQLAALNLPPEIYEQTIRCVSRIIEV